MLRKFLATLVVLSLLNINCIFAMGVDEGDEHPIGTPIRLNLLSSPDLEKQSEEQVGLLQTPKIEKNEDDSSLLGLGSGRTCNRKELVFCNAPLPFISFAGAFLIMTYAPMDWGSMLSVTVLLNVSLLSSLKLYYDCNSENVTPST